MRVIPHLNKPILFLGIVFFILLCSCHRRFTGIEGIVPQIIHIKSGDATTGKLILKDRRGNSAETFRVNGGAMIQWGVRANHDVKRIDSIYIKPNTIVDVFETKPRRETDLLWRGTVSNNMSGKTEDYNIDWTDKNDVRHTYDPKIQVK